MDDAFKHLSAQQLARLIQYAEAGDSDEKPDGARLHAEKNAPWVSGPYSHLRFPPYEFRPYPKWMFTADWMKADEQYRAAIQLQGRRGMNEEERARILGDATALRDACMRKVENPDEERALGPEWADSPTHAIENQERLDRAVAEAAAVSNYDDRNLGELAKREREAADQASEGHLVEVPRTPIRKKQEATT